MALDGLHITFGYAGFGAEKYPIPAVRRRTASQTMTVAGITDTSAPPSSEKYGEPAVVISNEGSSNRYYAVGAAPDASLATGNGRDTARELIRPGETLLEYCDAGDKVAWINVP